MAEAGAGGSEYGGCQAAGTQGEAVAAHLPGRNTVPRVADHVRQVLMEGAAPPIPPAVITGSSRQARSGRAALNVNRWQVVDLLLAQRHADSAFVNPGHGRDGYGHLFATKEVTLLKQHMGDM